MEFSRVRLIGTLGFRLNEICGEDGANFSLWGDGENFRTSFPHRKGGEIELTLSIGAESSWRLTRDGELVFEGKAETCDTDEIEELVNDDAVRHLVLNVTQGGEDIVSPADN